MYKDDKNYDFTLQILQGIKKVDRNLPSIRFLYSGDASCVPVNKNFIETKNLLVSLIIFMSLKKKRNYKRLSFKVFLILLPLY